MLHYLVLLGVLADLVGTAACVWDTLFGKTQPNRVTYLLWSLGMFIGSAAAFANGVRWAMLPTFAAGFCPFLVLLASFANKKSYWKLRVFDYVCGGLSLLGLVLWQITRQPDIAIVFAIAGDFAALTPTLRKLWGHPKTETPLFFACGAFAAATSFAAVRDWRFSECAFPLYLVVMDTMIFYIIYFRGRRKVL